MKILEFAKIVGKLKNIKRTGWVNQSVPNSESVADHSFRVTILSLVLSRNLKLDKEKVIKMALIHDVGESLVGDIIKSWGTRLHKDINQIKENEEAAIKKIFSLVNGDEYIKLYNEFEEQKTKEAQFVLQVDRLEFAIQMLEYEETHTLKFPSYFSKWPAAIMKDEVLKKILKQIEKLRKKK